MDILSESSTMHYQQQHSVTQPLHSSESNGGSCCSSPSASIRRNSRSSANRLNHRLSISLVLVTFLLTAMPSPIQAKYRLVPKRKRNTNKRQAAANSKSNSKIILKPKKKETANLQLEATVSTNEKGQKVLLLSPESTQKVESAMESSNQTNETQPNQMEAKQPKKQMSVVEESTEPQQGSAATSSSNSEEQQVLFYDPDELKTNPGEPPLPKKVYDESGNEVDMAGKEALLIKPHPPNPDPKSDEKVSCSYHYSK